MCSSVFEFDISGIFTDQWFVIAICDYDVNIVPDGFDSTLVKIFPKPSAKRDLLALDSEYIHQLGFSDLTENIVVQNILVIRWYLSRSSSPYSVFGIMPFCIGMNCKMASVAHRNNV